MKEQKIILQKVDSFKLKDIFECGQCFRWNLQEEGSYIGVIRQNVLKIKEEGENIIIEGIGNDKIAEIAEEYFDLKRDYTKIKERLTRIDKHMQTSIQYGQGIRLLNQDLWETILSFIISANNNIPRIKGIIERLCKKYGNKITWEGKDYFTFPTPEQLKDVTIKEYRELGLGFRDIRVYETTKKIISKQVDLEKMQENPNTFEVREQLLTLSGIGPKVADCILLFSNLKRLEVFPIDVWVRRVMNDLYIKEADETKVSKKQIEKIATEKFGDLAGIAQQYLFYWRREGET
ncbi:MAG: 8-oxoguanine DNA glycosylase [Clostridia bacterium]|nr:8-oxoguanine DNA glycosylase [Clostridia bacterium]